MICNHSKQNFNFLICIYKNILKKLNASDLKIFYIGVHRANNVEAADKSMVITDSHFLIRLQRGHQNRLYKLFKVLRKQNTKI